MKDALTSGEFLEMVAGERCPCGHLSEHHAAPATEPFAEKWGRCRYRKSCGCMGMLDWSDDEDEA